jgi:hypothetical protein
MMAMHFTQKQPIEKILGLHYSNVETCTSSIYKHLTALVLKKIRILARAEKGGLVLHAM